MFGPGFQFPISSWRFPDITVQELKFPKMPPLSISTKESHAWDLCVPDTWAPSKLVHPELPQTSDLFWEPLNPLCPAVLCRQFNVVFRFWVDKNQSSLPRCSLF